MSEEVERLKQEGNELFVRKEFASADALYSQALALCEDNELRKVLLTNRSATRLSLGKIEDAVQDADNAIQLDRTHLKAYYRKSAALEAWNKIGEAYYTWIDANEHCERHETLTKQLKKTKTAWLKVFRSPTYPVTSKDDLVRRIFLFTDKRERLSTLAHFWNDSSLSERFSYFQLLLRIIGGEGDLSEAVAERITPEVMVEMPMGNYVDMPRERLADWCDFFLTSSSEDKAKIFETIWRCLSSEEQHDIIRDMRVLFAGAANAPQADLVAEEAHEADESESAVVATVANRNRSE